jgi:hypothetical protein
MDRCKPDRRDQCVEQQRLFGLTYRVPVGRGRESRCDLADPVEYRRRRQAGEWCRNQIDAKKPIGAARWNLRE